MVSGPLKHASSAMIIVGAMAENRVIGSGDGMPWDVPEEYAHFQQLVAGGTIMKIRLLIADVDGG